MNLKELKGIVADLDKYFSGLGIKDFSEIEVIFIKLIAGKDPSNMLLTKIIKQESTSISMVDNKTSESNNSVALYFVDY